MAKQDEIDPRHVSAVQADIDRLIQNPPVRTPSASTFATEAADTAVVGMLDQLMAVAVKKTGLTREEIMSRWGKEDVAEPVSLEVSREVQRGRARRANMPEKYRLSVIDKVPIDCQALAAVKKFLAGRRKLLMLSGGHGTYKSGSSCYAIGQVEGSRYVDAIELVDVKLRDAKRYDELMNARLVVLDDLGREDKKPVQRSMFLDAWMRFVVNAYTRGRRLIVTSNTPWEFFERHEDEGGYGILAADRWKESGEWVDIEGESVRPTMRNAPHWTENPDADD